MSDSVAECCTDLIHEIYQAREVSEISGCMFQALICAYLRHPGWEQVTEAIFAKHGYTADEIRTANS